MIDADRLRNSYVGNAGTIEPFGTVWLHQNAAPGRRRNDYALRVFSPVLHECADGRHWAKAVGATIQILLEDKVVATLTHRQLEPTGPQLEGLVIDGGFVIDPKNERGSPEARALEQAARRIRPDEDLFRENPWARVDPRLEGRRVVVFWLDDDYAVAFHTDGRSIEATIEHPLARATWKKKTEDSEAGPSQ